MKGKQYVDRVRGRFTTQESFSRNIDPYYRKFQKKMYGGREWMNIILALGTIDETIVAKMNEIVRERTERGDPLHPRREHQLPAAERAPRTVQGVDHHISKGKRLRLQAKEIDKQIQIANRAWERSGRRHYTRSQWEALLAERERAWDEAICSTPTRFGVFNCTKGLFKSLAPKPQRESIRKTRFADRLPLGFGRL